MNIIPAIDIIDGRCVRLSQGHYGRQSTYDISPLEMAKLFENNGVRKLHIVDLAGARLGRVVNYKILEEICSQTELEVDFGGGLKDDNALRIAFESGANQVTIGSIAAVSPSTFLKWLREYGADRIILGADCLNEKISINGWTKVMDQTVIDFISAYQVKGVKSVICTDISKDGMLTGPSVDLYMSILKAININLIASGGIRSIDDLYRLKAIGCAGAILGKSIYEGQLSLTALAEHLNELSC